MIQGDPLFIFMYEVRTLPLICSHCNPGYRMQLWYANDASAGGSLLELNDWFTFGYFPEPTKSFIIVNVQWMEE